MSSGRTASRQGLRDTHSAPSPSPAGRLGPPHCRLPPGVSALSRSLFGVQGSRCSPLCFPGPQLRTGKEWFSTELCTFQASRIISQERGSEFGGSAGAHSDHSAPTRPWATLIKRGDAFQATHGPRAFYLGVGGVTRPGLLGTIPVLALRVQSREKPSTPDKLGWPVTF